MKTSIDRIRQIIFIAIISLLSLSGALSLILIPAARYSDSERRSLKQIPSLTQKNLSTGTFMSDFETFAQDQFLYRDGFRKIKAAFSKYVFNVSDNHGYFINDGFIYKLDNAVIPAGINANIARFNTIYSQHLKDTDCKIYLSIIPDKNYFLTGKIIPKIDYKDLVSQIRNNTAFAEYIDIFPQLKLDSYYKTDQHWKQTEIMPVAEQLASSMDFPITTDFTEKELPRPFYGTYYGQSARSVKPDTLKYLDSPVFNDVTVTSYNTDSAKPSYVYDMKKAEGRDPYEMFLSGSDALLTIENLSSLTDRELVIFRDSFGSSITPLLINSYSKITLVDLRYLNLNLLGQYLKFKDQDVLFLYSTLVLNSTTR